MPFWPSSYVGGWGPWGSSWLGCHPTPPRNCLAICRHFDRCRHGYQSCCYRPQKYLCLLLVVVAMKPDLCPGPRSSFMSNPVGQCQQLLRGVVRPAGMRKWWVRGSGMQRPMENAATRTTFAFACITIPSLSCLPLRTSIPLQRPMAPSSGSLSESCDRAVESNC